MDDEYLKINSGIWDFFKSQGMGIEERWKIIESAMMGRPIPAKFKKFFRYSKNYKEYLEKK